MIRDKISKLKAILSAISDVSAWPKMRKQFNYTIGAGYERIYFFHIRKTGGTSLNHEFLSQGGEPGKIVYRRICSSRSHFSISGDKAFVGYNRWLIEKGNYFYAFSHLPKYQLRFPENTFTIVCFRDPAARVLSHYRMLLEYTQRDVKHACMKKEGHWPGNSFAEFLKNIPKHHLLRQLYMFSENFDVEQACQNVMQCSHIMFTEDFAAGLRQLSYKTGYPLLVRHAKKNPIEVNIPSSQIDHLKSILKPEYDLLDKVVNNR